jgi:hypothetical protein
MCSSVKYTKDDVIDAAPAGPNWACHPGGGIQNDKLNKWFDYFVHLLKMSADDTVLLTANGHIYTPKNKYVTDMQTEQGVVIIHLPIYSTSKCSHFILVSWRPSKYIRHKRLKRD